MQYRLILGIFYMICGQVQLILEVLRVLILNIIILRTPLLRTFILKMFIV